MDKKLSWVSDDIMIEFNLTHNILIENLKNSLYPNYKTKSFLDNEGSYNKYIDIAQTNEYVNITNFFSHHINISTLLQEFQNISLKNMNILDDLKFNNNSYGTYDFINNFSIDKPVYFVLSSKTNLLDSTMENLSFVNVIKDSQYFHYPEMTFDRYNFINIL